MVVTEVCVLVCNALWDPHVRPCFYPTLHMVYHSRNAYCKLWLHQFLHFLLVVIPPATSSSLLPDFVVGCNGIQLL